MTPRDWYASLAERERRIVGWGGAAAMVLLLAVFVWKLGDVTAAADRRVQQKRQDLAWIEAVTPRLQAMPAARSGESLALAVDRVAREAGLGDALAGIEPAGPGALRVRLEKASFDALALALARLQQQRGTVAETATVNASGEAGHVDATLVLRGD